MARPDPRGFTAVHPASARGSYALAGPAAGVVGGLAMAACLMLSAAAQGLEPLTAIEPMGATFAGADGPPGADPPAALGLLLHLGVSALVGLLFALLLPPDFPAANAGVLCVGFAFAVMGFMTSAVVPAVNPRLESAFHDLGGTWVIAHAVFGFSTGALCQLLRRALELRAVRHPRRATA